MTNRWADVRVGFYGYRPEGAKLDRRRNHSVQQVFSPHLQPRLRWSDHRFETRHPLRSHCQITDGPGQPVPSDLLGETRERAVEEREHLIFRVDWNQRYRE